MMSSETDLTCSEVCGKQRSVGAVWVWVARISAGIGSVPVRAIVAVVPGVVRRVAGVVPAVVRVVRAPVVGIVEAAVSGGVGPVIVPGVVWRVVRVSAVWVAEVVVVIVVPRVVGVV